MFTTLQTSRAASVEEHDFVCMPDFGRYEYESLGRYGQEVRHCAQEGRDGIGIVDAFGSDDQVKVLRSNWFRERSVPIELLECHTGSWLQSCGGNVARYERGQPGVREVCQGDCAMWQVLRQRDTDHAAAAAKLDNLHWRLINVPAKSVAQQRHMLLIALIREYGIEMCCQQKAAVPNMY